MTTAAELRALADEVEGLEAPATLPAGLHYYDGAYRQLVAAHLKVESRICGALRRCPIGVGTNQSSAEFCSAACEGVTRFLDAAAGLMPEGWYSASGALEWQDRTTMLDRPGRAWEAEAWRPGIDMVVNAEAATEPLARTAAALRARAALIEASTAADGVA